MKLKIRQSDGKIYEFNSELSDKIGIYKDFLEEIIGISPYFQVLIFRGKILKNSCTLADYNYKYGMPIHLVLRNPFNMGELSVIINHHDTTRVVFMKIALSSLVDDIKDYLQDWTGIPYENIKLISKGNEFNDYASIIFSFYYYCFIIIKGKKINNRNWLFIQSTY